MDYSIIKTIHILESMMQMSYMTLHTCFIPKFHLQYLFLNSWFSPARRVSFNLVKSLLLPCRCESLQSQHCFSNTYYRLRTCLCTLPLGLFLTSTVWPPDLHCNWSVLCEIIVLYYHLGSLEILHWNKTDFNVLGSKINRTSDNECPCIR